MTRYYFRISFYSLVLLMAFITNCKGQLKTNVAADSIVTIPAGQPKLIKTQGTDQNQNTSCGLQDREGDLWFGTTGEGVFRYDGKLFTHYTTKDGLCSNEILSILEDKNGNIWFGTNNGLSRYDPRPDSMSVKGKLFTSIPIVVSMGNDPLSFTSPTPYLPEKNTIWSMIQDRHGIIWFGTFDGVYRYDPSTELRTGAKTFSYFLHNDGVINESGIQLKWIESILEDKNGNIWIGGRGNEGVFRYDGRSITRFTPDSGQWVRPLLEDKAGNIWFGSRKLMLFRYDGKVFSNFGEKDIREWIFSMEEDNDGNLWFSSARDGIYCYNGKSFKHFSTKDGLSHNSVWCTLKDREGNIWFGTKNIGLSRFDGKTFTCFSE